MDYQIPIIVSLLVIVSMSYSTSQSKSDCMGNYPQNLDKFSDSKLGKAFRKLKNQRGCEKWNSDLLRVMDELAKRLGKEGTPTNKLRLIMGMPDSYENNMNLIKLADHQDIWVYQWRGWHDWLYFIIENEKVVRADWWFAYE